MHRTFGWLTAGLMALGANVAGAQEKPDAGKTVPDTAAENGGAQRTERRIERRELRRSGELPAARANAAAAGAAAPGVDVAVPGTGIPGTGVDVNGARGTGAAITAPGVGVTVPPAGSGAGIGVNVPAAGIHATVNPNAWRYRWHNNRWWYYHPNSRWSFWNNNRWNAYRESNAATANNNPGTRRFSNSPRYESGYRGVPSNDHTVAPKPSNTDKNPPERTKASDTNVAPAP